MAKKPARRHAAAASPRPTGVRRVVYGCGRTLQIVGLLLVWWVLLLFTSLADMRPLLFWVLVAAGVFYAGWACTAWARKGR